MPLWNTITDQEIQFLRDDPPERKKGKENNMGVQRNTMFKRPKPVNTNANKLKKSFMQTLQSGSLMDNVSLKKPKVSFDPLAYDFTADLEWVRKDLEEKAKKKQKVNYSLLLNVPKDTLKIPGTSSSVKKVAVNTARLVPTKTRKKLSPTNKSTTKSSQIPTGSWKKPNVLTKRNETPRITTLKKTVRKLSLKSEKKSIKSLTKGEAPAPGSENEFLALENMCGIEVSCSLCPKHEALTQQVTTLQKKLNECLSQMSVLKETMNGITHEPIKKGTPLRKALAMYNNVKKDYPYLCTPRTDMRVQINTPKDPRKGFSMKLQKQMIDLYDTPRK